MKRTVLRCFAFPMKFCKVNVEEVAANIEFAETAIVPKK